MVGCAVLKCKRRSETSNFSKHGVSYHTFPKKQSLRKEWTQFCRRKDSWVPSRTSAICSDHFESSCFQSLSESNNRRILVENAKPTIFICDCKIQNSRNTSSRNDVSSNSACAHDFSADSKRRTQSMVFVSDTATSPSAQYETIDTPFNKKLIKALQLKNKKIKGLQTKNKLLKKKLNNLKALLIEFSSKYIVIKEEPNLN